MANTRIDDDVTEGDLVRPMLKLAWPLVVIQLLQVMYNVADTFWLGALSADAVGAISIAFPLVFLFISIGGGFTAAGAILIAQYAGAKSEESAGKVAGQTLVFVLSVSVVLALGGVLLTGPILELFPADPQTKAQILPQAAAYMRLFFLGLPFLFGFFVFVSLLRGYGNTRTPMRVMAVSVFINVVLDPLLIFGVAGFPRMEIEGAAIATVLSRFVATAIGLYVLFRTDAGPVIRREHLVPDLSFIRKIVRVGVPSAAEQSMSAIAMISLTAMVTTFPPAVVAAYGLGGRLISLVFLPAMGMGQATNTIVGQNLGAHRSDRAERATYTAAKITAAILFVMGVLAFLFPEPVIRVFISADTAQAAQTVRHGAEYLRVVAVMFAFMGALQVFLGAFRGAGNTKTALVFAAVTLWFARVPTTYLLVFVFDWGTMGLWAPHAFGDIVGCLAAGLWFSRGTWKSAIIDDESGDAANESADGTTAASTADSADAKTAESATADSGVDPGDGASEAHSESATDD